jgi:hypothetical protein
MCENKGRLDGIDFLSCDVHPLAAYVSSESQPGGGYSEGPCILLNVCGEEMDWGIVGPSTRWTLFRPQTLCFVAKAFYAAQASWYGQIYAYLVQSEKPLV